MIPLVPVTQAHVDALLLAIAKSQLRVRFPDGSEIEYRSLAEMREAVSVLRAEMKVFGPTSFVIGTSKGT